MKFKCDDLIKLLKSDKVIAREVSNGRSLVYTLSEIHQVTLAFNDDTFTVHQVSFNPSDYYFHITSMSKREQSKLNKFVRNEVMEIIGINSLYYELQKYVDDSNSVAFKKFVESVDEFKSKP